jgi:O-antigen ligase
MDRRWFLFWGCVLLVAGSLAGVWVTLDQRAEATRGWTNATQTLDVPYRLLLPGVNVELTQYLAEPGRLEAELGQIEAAGFVWVRQPFLWQNIQPDAASDFAWDDYDAIVSAVDEHDRLQLVAVLDGTPAWARSKLAEGHAFAPPARIADYAAFAQAVADRYGDTITYYQIWDEPNIRIHWGYMDPRPAHYTTMLCSAYAAIHSTDPHANVIAAALAPNVEAGPENLSDLRFLRAMYELGAGDCFDAAAAKPYGYSTGPYDRRVDAGVLNFSRWILLREEMVRRGDGKKPLWGSNFGWNHLPADWDGMPSIWGSVSAVEQERYTRDAYERARREWPWAGGLILQHWQPDADPKAGIQGFALAPVIDSWLAHGPLFPDTALIPGLYPPDNLHTIYSSHWQVRNSGADFVTLDAGQPVSYGADAVVPEGQAASAENRITVEFEGTAFALALQRDDYLAYLYVMVDGEPANALPANRQGDAYIILTAPEREPTLDMIVVADGLPEGPHTAAIIHRPDQGDDRWPIKGYAVATPPDTGRYTRPLVISGSVGIVALLGAVVIATRLRWRQVQWPSGHTVRRMFDWLLGLFASFLVLAGTLLTWGDATPALLRRDPPALGITLVTAGIAALSPVFVITLAALLVLAVMIYNRPLLGVMLVIFWSAFFMSDLDLLIRLFSAVEVYFVITLAAVLGRGTVAWAKQHRDPGQAASRLAVRLLPLDWLALGFAALGLLSLSWVEFLPQATREVRIMILEPVAFYGLLRVMKLERRDLLWLVDTLLFTGGMIAMVGLYLYVTGQSVAEAEQGAERLISVYGSPNGVGLYLGRGVPFALAYALLPLGAWRRAYGGVTGAVMLVALVFSQSRGALLLGLPALLAVMLLLWRGRRALLPLAVVLVALVMILIPLSMAFPRLTDLGGDTVFFREHLWYSSVNLIRERPLTGVGPDQFLYLYRSRYLLPEAWEEPNLRVPHNILLNHWAILGVGGVVIGVAFQAFFWRKLWRVYRRVRAGDVVGLALVLGLAGSMADFLAHGLVDVGYFSINLAVVFFLSLALLQHVDRIFDHRQA